MKSYTGILRVPEFSVLRVLDEPVKVTVTPYNERRLFATYRACRWRACPGCRWRAGKSDVNVRSLNFCQKISHRGIMILKPLQIWAIKAAIRQIRKVETKLEQMQK